MSSSGFPPAPVLVVGGGLVGLSAALFLAWRGVRTILVERHAASSLHPRAIGFTPRTLELLRAVGLGDRVPQAPADFRLRRARIESLAGVWHDETPWTPTPAHASATIEYSPCTGAAIAQDALEPILRDRAIELGADVRLSTALVGFTQDGSGVTATLRAADGSESTLHASYMIAADGHRSPVRGALGIGRDGRGHIRTLRSVLFRAPLDEYLARGVSQFQVEQPDFKAFLTTYQDGRWVLMFGDEAHDEATLRAMITRAIGRADDPIEIVTTGRWELSALIADRFSSGRVFLAGDAAHTLPPSRGGFGANTGIDDAHNLAWKIAAVLAGESSPQLLETYDAERRPIAWLRHNQIFARDDYKADAGNAAKPTVIFDDVAMELGQLYRSTSILGADATLPAAARPDVWANQPGTRAPHEWLAPERSTLDLLQRTWVLFADDDRWITAARTASETLGIPLTVEQVPGPARLIRPDGYIAYRARELPADPARALTDALGKVAAASRHVLAL